MSPQILGGLTSVAQKAQQANQAALQAQQMAANAAAVAGSNASAIAGLQAGVGALPLITLLQSPVTIAKTSMTMDGSWHLLSISSVPSSAKFMYVGGYVTNQGSTGGGVDNGRQTLYLSPDNGSTEYLVSYSNGVAGVYENDQPIGPCVVPCSGSGIYYQWSNGITDTNLVFYGYI